MNFNSSTERRTWICELLIYLMTEVFCLMEKWKAKKMLLTGCPTGIAHTYMAAEALEKKAQELGYPIKVETRGSGGSGMLYGHGGYYGWRYGSTGGNCRGL